MVSTSNRGEKDTSRRPRRVILGKDIRDVVDTRSEQDGSWKLQAELKLCRSEAGM